MNFYEHDGGLYANLTNRCPVACDFCAKRSSQWRFSGHDLLLRSEAPLAALRAELRERLSAPRPWSEIVFCGYGESTYRLAEMSRLGRDAKELRPAVSVRLNTIGLGDLIWGRDIVPELARFLDSVSVSLNTCDPRQWLRLHRPAPTFRARGFAAARLFARRCVAAGLRTRVTAVDLPGVDLGAVRDYARLIGAEFLARPPLRDGAGGNPPAVLIVDDDESLRTLLGLALRRAGYPTLAAASGSEALDLLASGTAGFVVADGLMKAMDVFELARRAKDLRPELRIAVVNAAFGARGAESAPIDRLFEKPASVADLVAWLQTFDAR